MSRLDIVNFGWNQYNGFCIELLNIEWNRFEGILLGTSFSFGDYWHIHILFLQIEVRSPLYLKDLFR
jgi:hypothetical protein